MPISPAPVIEHALSGRAGPEAQQRVAAGVARGRRRAALLARMKQKLGPPAAPAAVMSELDELNALADAAEQLIATSQAIHRFAWQAARTEKNPPTVKAVWTGPGQRRDLYGAAAKKALATSAAIPPAARPLAPAGPSQPTGGPVSFPTRTPTAAPTSAAPTPAPGPGKVRRAAGAVGSGAKATGKAAWTVAGKLQEAAAWTTAKTMAVMVRVGQKLKALGWLERNLGLGRAIEKDATRKLRRALAVKAAAAAGGLGAGTAAFAGASAKLAGLRWRSNKRKYGTAAAVTMEVAYFALTATKKLKGLLLGAPLLSIVLKPIAGVVGVLVNSATRIGLNFAGKHLLAKRELKRNKNAAGRVATRMDTNKRPVALPGAVVSRARDIRRGAGPGDLVPTNGATTSRSRRFSEGEDEQVPEFDPAELVRDLRSMVEETTGEPLDVPDGELGQVVSLTARLLERKATAASPSGGT